MEWAGDCLERLPAPQPECKGLKDTFADGKAFLGILHAVAPEKHAYDPSEDPCDNMKRAFQRAEDEYVTSEWRREKDELKDGGAEAKKAEAAAPDDDDAAEAIENAQKQIEAHKVEFEKRFQIGRAHV